MVLDQDGHLARHPDLTALRTAVSSGATAPDVVVAAFVSADTEDVVGQAHAATKLALELVREWSADDLLSGSRLVVLTRGAVATSHDEDVRDLAVAGVWGLLRTAQSENPDRILLLDIDAPASAATIAAALATDEPQLAVRAGRFHAPRLAAPADDDLLLPPPNAPAWRLDVHATGTLDNLALLPAPGADRALREGEVRIAVRAAGLNFRDVLMALGMYPGPTAIGSEAAGTVTEVGPGVSDLAPGDRVMGLFPQAFGPAAVTDRRLVTPIPAGWTFAQAATAPVVYLTAYYALTDLARLRPGDRILVHSAAGGVGMAATHLARHLGAEVYATAHPDKWGTLRELGVPDSHIASSRTLDFRRHINASTGLDVVLNQLTRDFIDASLDLLGAGGHFLEMGKTDLRDPDEVAARHPGISYQPFDMYDAGPDRIQQMLGELGALFDSGALPPLPVTTWDIHHARHAFRHLREAAHVGKIALTMPTPLDPDGTILVTGGTGELGALVARHLVTGLGAKHLVLASRRGPAATGAEAVRAELTEQGAEVTVAACDIADRADLARLLAAIPERHPLTAVIHVAGVLADGTIGTLTDDQVDTVLRPKVDAAWHLHELTKDDDLAAFVVFSSVAGVLGNPGQANYAAANAFLDALDQHRRLRRQPATSLAWGLWATGGGMTGQITAAEQTRMARTGLLSLTPDEGLHLLDTALPLNHAQLVAARLDLAALRTAAASRTPLPMLRQLVPLSARRAGTADVAAGNGSSVLQRLDGLPRNDQRQVLLDVVRTNVAAVLGHTSPHAVEPDRAFADLGFDSLTAVELRNRINSATALRLPATLVFDHRSPAALSEHLLTELIPEAESATTQLVGELDRLESALSALATEPESAGRSEITVRLQTMLSKWMSAQHTNAEFSVDDELHDATAGEIFDFIDKQLGRTLD